MYLLLNMAIFGSMLDFWGAVIGEDRAPFHQQ